MVLGGGEEKHCGWQADPFALPFCVSRNGVGEARVGAAAGLFTALRKFLITLSSFSWGKEGWNFSSAPVITLTI